MKTQTLDKLFIDQLEDMYSSEIQILDSLPKLIRLASFPKLKEALSNHLKETENQVERIEKILEILDIPIKEKHCEAMEGILKEGGELVKNKNKSAALDAAIISAAQKVEHYEIAAYGSVRTFADMLGYKDAAQLLQKTLEEEKAADQKLTELAERTVNMGAAETEDVRKPTM